MKSAPKLGGKSAKKTWYPLSEPLRGNVSLSSLFDASSLINLTLRKGGKALSSLKDQHALDLTFYEAGNALWKLCVIHKRLSVEEANACIRVIGSLMSWINILSVSEVTLNEVMEVATKNLITFYDAAYVVVAKSKGLTLVTDDVELGKAALKYVPVKSSKDI